MALKAISFDADQTLWDFRAVQGRALDTTARAMIDRGLVEPGTVDARRLQEARNEVVARFRGRPHSLEEVRWLSFESILDQAGVADPKAPADELLAIFMDVRFNQIELYPEVAPSLERLRAQYRIGLLTNGNSDPERCGLGDTFHAVVLGPTFGFEKPDPLAFETMADALGVEPGDMVHVGDDWDDVTGANGVGAVSVFLNRDDADPDFRQQADHEIRDLNELEALLEHL